MAGEAAGVARVLSMYRQLLRVHRAKLPGPLRSIGDSYVQEEFRRHLRGKTTPQQWQEFGAQWGDYLAMMQGKPSGISTPEVEMDVLGQLSPQQRQQLSQLKAELSRAEQQQSGQQKMQQDGSRPLLDALNRVHGGRDKK